MEPETVEKALLFAAVAGPLVGTILGIVLGAHEKRSAPKILVGVLLGGLATVIYGMWRLYGLITQALGLDSVVNLGLQLLLFAAVGAVVGFVMFKVSEVMRSKRRVQ